MPTQLVYPKVSLETSSGKISQWLVAEGDVVQAGQILFEIENDKAAVEVESPAAGVMGHLIAAGTEVDVGAQVALIYAADEKPGDANKPLVGAATAVAQSESPRPAAPPTRQGGPRPTPLARRIARDENVSLEGLCGTGPRGRVQKKDVVAHLAALAHSPADPALRRPAEAGLHHVWLRRGTGVPLVLLHGFSSDLNSWRGMFAGERFDAPVLALDLPGHGQSTLEIPVDMGTLVQQVEHAISALVDGPLVLAGHSFGAAVAARIAAGGMCDLRGLCLFAPAGLGPEINGAFIDGILRAREAGSLRPWLNELVQDSATMSDAFVRAVVEQRQNSALTDAMRAFADRFLPDGTQSQTILPDLARLTLPTRVIFGRNDRILPFARTADLPGHIALHAIAACGHMPQLEQPSLSLRILSQMLACA